MKKIVQTIIPILGILLLLVIIIFSVIGNIGYEVNAKSSNSRELVDTPVINKEDKNKFNISTILNELKKSNKDDIKKVYENYLEISKNWDSINPEIAETLKEYFDDYFDLQFALDFCNNNEIQINKVRKIINAKVYRPKTKKIKSSLTNDPNNKYDYQNNKYFQNTKIIDKGIKNCIVKSITVSQYMEDRNTYNLDILIVKLLKSLYLYSEIDLELEEINFQDLTILYEENIIKKLHNNTLTKNDTLVLELREVYSLRKILKEKNTQAYRGNCETLISDIKRIKNDYPNYIDENGSYKDAYNYLIKLEHNAELINSADKGNPFKPFDNHVPEAKGSGKNVTKHDEIPYFID
jgi:hypothetical protein